MSASASPQMPDAQPEHTGTSGSHGPYAGPRGGVVSAVQMARVAPYIPAAWRAAVPVTIPGPGPVTGSETLPVSAPSQAAADELPWIDVFLASTPPAGLEVVGDAGAGEADTAEAVTAEAEAAEAVSGEGFVGEVASSVDVVSSDDVHAATTMESAAAFEADIAAAMDTHETSGVPASEMDVGPVAEPVVEAGMREPQDATELPDEPVSASEQWPLDDAAPEFEALSQGIDAEHGPDASMLFNTAADPANSAPWSDEDFMDIMPVRRSYRTPLSSPVMDGVSWAERARAAQAARDADPLANASPDDAGSFPADAAGAHHAAASDAAGADPGHTDAGHTQASDVGRAVEAAEALETLARRVRAGELAVPEFDARGGEPAALVAALAAVLGVRLR